MNERKNDLAHAEALFREELMGFVRTVSARAAMLLETNKNLERRRAIVEAAKRTKEGSHVEEPNQAS